MLQCSHNRQFVLIILDTRTVSLAPVPGYCEIAVRWADQGVCCDNCSLWFHRTCHSMSLTKCGEIGHRSWKCYRCRSHISDTFHSYELDSQTQLPADSHADNERAPSVSSAPSPGSFHPQSHSSPLTSNGTPLAVPPNSTLFSSLGHTHDSSDATTHPPSRSRNWRSMVINVNSIVNKRAEFEAAVDADAIFMSETKLNNQIANAECIPPGYNAPLRKDRNKHGGVVLLAICDCYSAAAVDMPDSPAEIVWSKVSLRNQRKLFFGACYRSPSGDANTQLEELENSLKGLRKITRNAPSNIIVLGGDFNLKDINRWQKMREDAADFGKTFLENLHSKTTDENGTNLKVCIQKTIEDNVPAKTTSKRHHQPWTTSELKRKSRKTSLVRRGKG